MVHGFLIFQKMDKSLSFIMYTTVIRDVIGMP